MVLIHYSKGNKKRIETVKYYDGCYEMLISLDKDVSYYDVFDVRNKYLCHLQYIKMKTKKIL